MRADHHSKSRRRVGDTRKSRQLTSSFKRSRAHGLVLPNNCPWSTERWTAAIQARPKADPTVQVLGWDIETLLSDNWPEGLVLHGDGIDHHEAVHHRSALCDRPTVAGSRS